MNKLLIELFVSVKTGGLFEEFCDCKLKVDFCTQIICDDCVELIKQIIAVMPLMLHLITMMF